jgi:uncharacterized membrane protein
MASDHSLTPGSEDNPNAAPEPANGNSPGDDQAPDRPGHEPAQEGSGVKIASILPDAVEEDERSTRPTSRSYISACTRRIPAWAFPGDTRNLNEVVQRVLGTGLVLSAAMLLLGLAQLVLAGRPLPTATLPPGEAIREALGLQPSGLLTLGILLLLVTPVLRVVGSILVFICDGDRLYALVTFAVLVVVIIGALLGQG